MSLRERLAEYVRACFTGLWIQSHEHEDALAEIAQLCRQHDWRLVTWDIDRGLSLDARDQPQAAGGNDPLAAIRALSSLASDNSSALLVLVNFHRFLQSAEIVQAVSRQIADGKQNRTFVVVLSPVVQIPAELERQIVVLEHDLPDREQLLQIARGVATEGGELPEGDDQARLLDAAAGLTRMEAENAFSLSLVRHQRLAAETLWELKSQSLKKSGLLALHRGRETFADLGGLENLKAFCLRALRRSGSTAGVRPRGVLLLSPPGCGKSAFAKALGNETGRPTLVLDVGSLMGSLVGQTEQQTRQALRIVDAMAPCLLFADELDKALSGVASSGQTDSGVSARLFGNLLTWLNDHDSDVFFVGTLNDISRLPPEFSRAERFDGVFFIDLPAPAERESIWRMYLARFNLDPRQVRPADSDWTGAEIRACCRLAALLDVPLVAAGQNVVPVARTSAEAVERLRAWASGRCLSAERSGIYQRVTAPVAKPGRRIPRDPSVN
jgi:SpoVK/Ycf46/Vps4 family AAA+-type ATPase